MGFHGPLVYLRQLKHGMQGQCTPMFVERKVCYSALFTNLVGWHSGAVNFPLSDVILAQHACPPEWPHVLFTFRITNLSLCKHWWTSWLFDKLSFGRLTFGQLLRRQKMVKMEKKVGEKKFLDVLNLFICLATWWQPNKTCPFWQK